MKLILPNSEEIEKIKNNDTETINRFYLDNIEYVKRYACSFCRRIRDYSELEDIVHEVYLHFPKLSFENERFFGHDVFKVFFEYHYGNQRKREQMRSHGTEREEYVLDSPVKGLEKTGDTVGDVIPDNMDLFNEVFPQPNITDSLYYFLSAYLAKEQKKVFTQFYYTGKTYKEVAETLKKNVRTVKRTREQCFKKFRERLPEIKLFLVSKNYVFSDKYVI